jgi:hypothetical protein
MCLKQGYRNLRRVTTAMDCGSVRKPRDQLMDLPELLRSLSSVAIRVAPCCFAQSPSPSACSTQCTYCGFLAAGPPYGAGGSSSTDGVRGVRPNSIYNGHAIRLHAYPRSTRDQTKQGRMLPNELRRNLIDVDC